jgi:Fur family zinc uptake transcriptional regulator
VSSRTATRSPPGHDHDQCVARALESAEAVCRAHGVRLTTNRRRVLEIIWRNHDVMGAYEILEILQRDEPRTKPPTVYRALEFLQEQGLVHRIESSNAFTRCETPLEHEHCQFLVCDQCGRVEEVHSDALPGLLDAAAREHGFQPRRFTIEVRGTCRRCV